MEETTVMRMNTQRTSWRPLGGAVGLTLLAIASVACDAGAYNRTPGGAALTPGGLTTIPQIARDPAAYVGKTVTLSGEIEKVPAPQTFIIDGDGFVGGIDLLVVTKDAVTDDAKRAAKADDVVLVTGTLRRFDEQAIEKELGIDLPNNFAYAEWAGKVVIIAREVALTPRAEGTAGVRDQRDQTGITAPPATVESKIDRIVDSPTEFVGKTVRVTGEVDKLRGGALVLEDRDLFFDDEILVVIPPALRAGTNVAEEAIIEVTGTVRLFELGVFRNDYGVDLDQGMLRAWTGKPAIVATAVRPVPAVTR
jgi:hypothetical protein